MSATLTIANPNNPLVIALEHKQRVENELRRDLIGTSRELDDAQVTIAMLQEKLAWTQKENERLQKRIAELIRWRDLK